MEKIALPSYPWILLMRLEKQNHSRSGIRTTKSAAEHYLSAYCFNPHSCITIDCSWIWQIKRGLHNGHNTLSLFLWLKSGQEANVPDETHHSDVNDLSFFGVIVLCITLKSQDAVRQHKSSPGVNSVCSKFLIWYDWYLLGNSWILQDLKQTTWRVTYLNLTKDQDPVMKHRILHIWSSTLEFGKECTV